MLTGTVKRIVRDRGFGFIIDDGGTEYFFHRSGVRSYGKENGYDTLNEGELVTFEEQGSDKGPRATNIEKRH